MATELPAWHLQLSASSLLAIQPVTLGSEKWDSWEPCRTLPCAVHVLGQAKFDKKGISRLQKSLRLGDNWARTGVLRHWGCYLTPLPWLDLPSRQSSASVERLKLVGLLQQHLWWVRLFAKRQFSLNTGKGAGALQSRSEVKSLLNYCPLGEMFFLQGK